MPMAIAESRRNGTGAAMPIKTIDITLDEIGYPGWFVTMRTNPRSSLYDALIQTANEEMAPAEKDEVTRRSWAAFGQIVISWNFANEEGEALPQPRDVAGDKDLDLPHGVMAYVLTRYFDAVNAAAAIPKAQPGNSVPISSTSVGDPTSD